MGYKITGAIEKGKKHFIIYGILWLICVIVFIMPISVGIVEASKSGTFNIGDFFEITINNVIHPFSSFIKVFKSNYIGDFWGVLWKFTLAFVAVAIFGTIRNAPKSEYEDIEHGSSDWSKNGEQYKILSNKKGIILAEDNYLPVNKRGNVNVLVVGRFRFW